MSECTVGYCGLRLLTVGYCQGYCQGSVTVTVTVKAGVQLVVGLQL